MPGLSAPIAETARRGTPRRYAPGMQLTITGLVDNEVSFSSEELSALPTTEGRVPGRKGRPDTVAPAFRLSTLLDRVPLGDGATHATAVSADTGYRASIPLATLRDHGLVMHTPDGPTPWRLVVPDGETLCWNVKGLVRLEVTAGPAEDDVPEVPPH